MRGKHYYYFGLQHYEEGMLFNELDVKMWDKLRCENIKTPFSIERTKEDYETNCKNRIDYYDKAKIICDNIEAERVVSLGVGTGILEWHMKNLKDDMELVCSDYTEGALKLLQNVTNCSEFKVFDMYADDYRWMVQFDYVIMHRLDTEFSFDSWKKIFYKMYHANVKRIIFIPSLHNTTESISAEEKWHQEIQAKGYHDTFCGWLYTRDEWVRMWDGHYCIDKSIDYEDTTIYFLKRLE